ncbi:MAG: DUF1549 domain-containing protein, partial [Planctomycetota bacterium]
MKLYAILVILVILVTSLTSIVEPLGAAPTGARQVVFNRDIRPLLSDRCYACHGPDSASRESDLRLDVRESAVDFAIVPGDAAESELLARISTNDADLRMPPPDSHKSPLTSDEVELFRRWIDQGAEYQPHWSYAPVRRVEPPSATTADGPSSEIDRFLQTAQRARGASPALPADRVALARRLYLDLIGLPPTPDEVDRFVDNDAPDAYTSIVDELLASPHYGERMATWWFDL